MPNIAVVAPVDLGSEFLLGTAVPNKITLQVDGLSVTRSGSGVISATAPTVTYNPITKTLTYTPPGGAAQNIDLSGLAVDVTVNGGSFNATTNILTLSDNDPGSPDITIDLGALLGVSSAAGNQLTNGADNKPFLASSTIQTIANASSAAAVSSALTMQVTNAFGNVNLFKAAP